MFVFCRLKVSPLECITLVNCPSICTTFIDWHWRFLSFQIPLYVMAAYLVLFGQDHYNNLYIKTLRIAFDTVSQTTLSKVYFACSILFDKTTDFHFFAKSQDHMLHCTTWLHKLFNIHDCAKSLILIVEFG